MSQSLSLGQLSAGPETLVGKDGALLFCTPLPSSFPEKAVLFPWFFSRYENITNCLKNIWIDLQNKNYHQDQKVHVTGSFADLTKDFVEQGLHF